jgi:TPP-dependent 2-oxoacid decarboxylase
VQGIIDTLQHDLIAQPSTSFLCETGDSWFIGQKLVLPAQANFFIQMQYGSIGWALGALIGIRLAPKSTQKTVALIGDGSFQVTVEALSTLVRERTKATILLLNNHGYGIEAKIHDGPYNDIQNWNYAQLAEIFKDHADGEGNKTLPATSRALGVKVKTMEEFREAVRKADLFEGVTLIECAIDKEDSTDELVAFGTKISKSNMRV